MAIRFLDPNQADYIKDGINADPEFRLASKFFAKDILLIAGDSRCLVKVSDGRVSEIVHDPGAKYPWAFFIKGSVDGWEKFLQPTPPPFHNHLYPAMIRQVLEIGGDLESAFAHFWPVSRMLDIMRELQNS